MLNLIVLMISSFFFFFFFKQKTAYEMRISDWSSDVCSSDLANPRRQVDHAIFNAAIITHKHGQCLTLRQRHKTELPQHGLPLWHQYDSSTGREPGQIGRASGRERVCQYV